MSPPASLLRFSAIVMYVRSPFKTNDSQFLADRTATQYSRLLASSSVRLSVTLCIVACRIGVQAKSCTSVLSVFRHLCCRTHRLATKRTENKKAVLMQGEPRDAAVNFDTY